MTVKPSAIGHSPAAAEAKLELLTRINRAISGLTPTDFPPYPPGEALGREECLDQFQDRILDYKAAFWRVRAADAPQAVSEALAGAQHVVVPSGLNLDWLPGTLNIMRDEPPLSHAQLDEAEAVVTACAVAISETGTIILNHAADQGRRALTLIPDRHVCLIRAEQVVQSVLEGVQRVGESVREGRPLTWLSGGSATSDIELVRVEGVHGPRKLCVVVLDE